MTGGDGGRGFVLTAVYAMGGIGGDAPMGGGEAAGGANQGDGSPGNPYGGGGGGASADTTTGTTGGAGASGVIKITEFFDSGSAAILAGGLPTGGSAGQVLSKNSGTNYDASWVNDLGLATLQTGLSGSLTTASTSSVMMGLGTGGNAAVITPVRSGKIFVSVNGRLGQSTVNAIAQGQLRYGTGTPPAYGAAGIGTTIGGVFQLNQPIVNGNTPFAATGMITGLVLGTQIWLDLGLLASGGGSASVASVAFAAYELP
jgi:hypothetical protein